MGDIFVKKVLSDKISIYRRGNDEKFHYHYYFRLDGKTFRGTCHSKNLDDSEEYSIIKYNEIKKNKGPQKTTSFPDCVKLFFEFKNTRVKPTTITTYRIHSRYLLEYFRSIDPNSITSEHFENYDKWRRNYSREHPRKNTIRYKRKGEEKIMKKPPHTVGDILINREIALLRNILRFGIGKNLLSIKEIPPWEKYDENRRELTLSKTEYLKLQQYFLKTNPYYWSIISFVVNTGLRYKSEINELRWCDIKLEKNYMIIRNRKGRKKSDKKIWSVPIVGTSEKILNELKNRNVSTNPDDYVFVNNQGKRILNISRSFKKGLIECGITKNLCMYSLRHTYVTKMIETRPDIPLKILAESLGHRSVSMIEKHYGHLRPDTLVKYFRKSEKTRQRILERRRREEEKERHKLELQGTSNPPDQPKQGPPDLQNRS